MIDAIVGQKGSGKTSKLVDEINVKAQKNDVNIVCLEYGKRFDKQIPYQVRLIDITEYPVSNYAELLAFIAGISAKDYDISHFYIDSIYKVANDDSKEDLEQFISDLNTFSEKVDINFTITISDDIDSLPENVRKAARSEQ